MASLRNDLQAKGCIVAQCTRLFSNIRFVSAPRAVLKALVEKHFPMPPQSRRQQQLKNKVTDWLCFILECFGRIQMFGTLYNHLDNLRGARPGVSSD